MKSTSAAKPQVAGGEIESLQRFWRETSTQNGFAEKTSSQNRLSQQNRRSASGKSNLCRCSRRKRLHKLNFAHKTAGQLFRNRIFAEVLAGNVDTKRICRPNVGTEWISAEKTPAEGSKIDSVSRFGLKTSTQNRFSGETSTQNGFSQENRRSGFGKSNLCRGLSAKRRHKIDFCSKTAGRALGNRNSVEVSSQNVYIERILARNVDTELSCRSNVGTEWISLDKFNVKEDSSPAHSTDVDEGRSPG